MDYYSKATKEQQSRWELYWEEDVFQALAPWPQEVREQEQQVAMGLKQLVGQAVE